MIQPLFFDAATLSTVPRVDCHLHTSWTDGAGSVREVWNQAVACRLDTILFSEHSRKTSTDWFDRFAAEVRALPQDPCLALVGTEVKVENFDGAIDTVPAIAELCDFVMVSVHRFPDGKGGALAFNAVPPDEAVDIEFQLSWAALANPQTDILGHMFGMSWRKFHITPPDDKIRALITRAAEHNVVIEVNSRYHPAPQRLIAWCAELGARVTFGSNAHTLGEVGDIVRVLENGGSL